MSTPDPRPRPQYGEYATPAEQKARIAHPQPPAVHTPAPSSHPVPSGAGGGRPASSAAPHPVDRVATFALLAYGAFNVITSAIAFFDLAGVADMTYRMMGIAGSFTSTPTSRAWGIAAAVLLVLGYAATVWLSMRTMRRGRLSWWIPIAGAVVTYIVVSVCVSIPLMSDPAFAAYLHAG